MIVETERLDAAAITEALTGEALAVRVRGYVSGELCERLSAALLALLDDSGRERIYRSNLPAYTDVSGEPERRRAYLRVSADVLAELRTALAPYQSPVDRLRCELDERWPGGARLLRVGANPLVFGMARLWQDGTGAVPHIDELMHVAPEALGGGVLEGQLGVNIHLLAPSGDGDGLLDLWDLGREDLGGVSRDGVDGYGYRRGELPEPAVSLAAERGDLVLLRSGRLHAVRPTRSGRRLTLSGFIGHRGGDRPLLMWS